MTCSDVAPIFSAISAIVGERPSVPCSAPTAI
jgi:hypothetical protein